MCVCVCVLSWFMINFSLPQLLSAIDWLYTSFMHISSLGDGFREAPGAELIEPKVDEFSEIIKYKLFDLNITEADIHIMEDSTITRLQVSLMHSNL